MLSDLTKAIRDYAPDSKVPLTGYTAAMLTYALVLGGVLVSISRKGRWQPRWMDLLLLGVASHKLSRIVTKDFVTSPLRAPFTRRQAQEGAGEVKDQPRGNELQSSIGFLLTCPYCAGPWLATALGALLAWKPLQTRFVLQLLAAVAISDFLHLEYSRLNESRKSVIATRQFRELN